MSLRVALRTDLDIAGVTAFLSSRGSGLGTRETREDGTGEHWHWYLECDSPNIQALRMAFKRAVGLTGNGGYSMKLVSPYEQDKLKYLRYMCKGTGPDFDTQGPKVVWRQSIEIDAVYIQRLHREYWHANAEMKKKGTVKVMDAVLDRCQERSIPWHDRRAIAHQYVVEMVSRKKPINTFAAKAVVNTLQVLLGGSSEAIELLCDQI